LYFSNRNSFHKVSLHSSDGDGSLQSCKEDILEEFSPRGKLITTKVSRRMLMSLSLSLFINPLRLKPAYAIKVSSLPLEFV